jgi:hypothetical protein
MVTEEIESNNGHRGPRAKSSRAGTVLACAAVATVATAVAGFAWSRPSTEALTAGYTQAGNLSYTASVPANSIYGNTGLRTGEPVYTTVAKTLELNFSYHFRASVPSSVSGTEQLEAAIDNGQGVTRTIFVTPVTSFRGHHFATGATLNLATLNALASAFQRADDTLSTNYTVTISPSVRVHGELGGSVIATTFAPRIQFGYDSSTLVPASVPGPATAGGASSGPATSQPSGSGMLAPTTTGAVVLPSTKANTLFSHNLSVTDVRAGSLAVLVLALVIGLLSGRGALREATSGEEGVRITARYGAQLVAVETLPHSSRAVVVELATFGGLMQVARRLECPVLHHAGTADTYAVVDNATIYRYRATARQKVARHSTSGEGTGRGVLVLALGATDGEAHNN